MNMVNENTLTLKLLGKDYKIACAPESQARLRAAADLLETRLQAIAATVKGTNERLAMMAALDLAHEYLGVVDAQGDSKNSVADTSANENLQRTIDSIEARINVALEQE